MGLKVDPAGAECLCILHWQDDPRHSSGSPDDTPRSSGASGIFDLRNLAADSLLPSLLERTAPEDGDRRNEALRRQHRPRALLALYPAPDEVGHTGSEADAHAADTLCSPSNVCWVPRVHPPGFFVFGFFGVFKNIYLRERKRARERAHKHARAQEEGQRERESQEDSAHRAELHAGLNKTTLRS